MNRSAISKMLMKIYSRISDPANNHKYRATRRTADQAVSFLLHRKRTDGKIQGRL